MIDIALHTHHQKFFRDTIEYEDDHYNIQTGGVFTAKSTREERSLARHIISAYESYGETFVKELRGSFFIYLYVKQKNLHLIYTNHLGDKRIYYSHQQGITIVSNSLKEITSRLDTKQVSYSLDTVAAYYLLTYGYQFGNRTLVAEINKLRPGEYLRVADKEWSVKSYHTLSNTPNDQLTENDAVERVDQLFRQAISREYEKDKEYGFTSLCTLSGGLDSRMSAWVGHEMGYMDMVNFTFAQTGSPDMTIAGQIAKHLNHQWIFQSLDHGEFMSDIDEVNRITEGAVYHLPISHGKHAIDQIDYSRFGIFHSGQLGDVTLSSYLTLDEYAKPSFPKAISNRLLHKLPVEDLEEYENQELMLYQNRGLNFILAGNLPVQQYSEVTSPFLDVDFLEFCMTIPLKYRINHHLYKKWILAKYPQAAAFKWEKLGRRITTKTIRIRGKEMALTHLPAFVLQGVRFHLDRAGNRHRGVNRGMNPFQFWYNTSDSVQYSFERYLEEHLEKVEAKEIAQDCKQLFSMGSVHEKAQVLTLISAIKLIWH